MNFNDAWKIQFWKQSTKPAEADILTTSFTPKLVVSWKTGNGNDEFGQKVVET